MLAHLSFQYQGSLFFLNIKKLENNNMKCKTVDTIAIKKHAAHIINQLPPSHFNKQTKQGPCKKPISNIFKSKKIATS